MSQSRDDNANTNAAPWLSNVGLWSPSTPSSTPVASPSALAPATAPSEHGEGKSSQSSNDGTDTPRRSNSLDRMKHQEGSVSQSEQSAASSTLQSDSSKDSATDVSYREDSSVEQNEAMSSAEEESRQNSSAEAPARAQSLADAATPSISGEKPLSQSTDSSEEEAEQSDASSSSIDEDVASNASHDKARKSSTVMNAVDTANQDEEDGVPVGTSAEVTSAFTRTSDEEEIQPPSQPPLIRDNSASLNVSPSLAEQKWSASSPANSEEASGNAVISPAAAAALMLNTRDADLTKVQPPQGDDGGLKSQHSSTRGDSEQPPALQASESADAQPRVEPSALASDVDAASVPSDSTASHASSAAPPPARGRKRDRSATPTGNVSAGAGRAAQPAVAWVSCAHSDPPSRYRDTPAYYCTYCSYTVCEACYALIPAASLLSAEAPVSSSHHQPQEKTNNTTQSAKVNHMVDKGEEAKQRGLENEESARDGGTSTSMDWLDDVLHSSATAVRRGVAGSTGSGTARQDGGAATLTTEMRSSAQVGPQGSAVAPHVSSSTSAAPPLLCHLCRRGHFLREEALLHEWCCEGPDPPQRRHRGHALVYNTQNLQKYHFMRAQRETRLASTAPLHAYLLSVSPAALGSDSAFVGDAERSHDEEGRLDKRRALQLRQNQVKGGAGAAARRDPLPDPAVHATHHHATRRTTAAALQGAATSLSPYVRRQRGSPHSPYTTSQQDLHRGEATNSGHGSSDRRSTGPSCALQNCACEEGGSFVFAVRNPRLEVPLVWCAVNRQEREEAPAYASATGSASSHPNYHHHTSSLSSGGAAAASTITPLLLWRCPPSLPGLPARPYRLTIPYGLYAFANVHALTLYVASDIFRKASTQLVGAPASSGGGGGGGGRGSTPWLDNLEGPSLLSMQQDLQFQQQQQQLAFLTSMKVAPAASLRPLLTVTVLHHIATTPRPIAFPLKLPTHKQALKSDSLTLNKQLRESGTESTSAPERLTGNGVATATSNTAERTKDTPPNAMADHDDEENAEGLAAPRVQWPGGLASAELALCLDHLLHGRSVAVYGVGSKFFFLHHVASSAALQSFHVAVVDASYGRVAASTKGNASGNNNHNGSGSGVSKSGGGHRRGPGAFMSSSSSSNNNNSGNIGNNSGGRASVTRQLLSIGHLLMKQTSDAAVLTAETRAALTARAFAAAEAKRERRAKRSAARVRKSRDVDGGKALRGDPTRPRRHTKLSFDDDEDGEDSTVEHFQPHANFESSLEVARAVLRGEVGRSPAVARDVTAAGLHAGSAATQAQRKLHFDDTEQTAVEVVDVDSASSSSSSLSSLTSPASTATNETSSVSSSTDSEEERRGGAESEKKLGVPMASASCAPLDGSVTPAKGTVREVLPFVSQTPPQNSCSSTNRNNNNNNRVAMPSGRSPVTALGSRAPLLLTSPVVPRPSQLQQQHEQRQSEHQRYALHSSSNNSGSPSQSQRLSQHKTPQGTATQLDTCTQASALSPPSASPIPAFFEALQRSVLGEDNESVSNRNSQNNNSNNNNVDAAGHRKSQHGNGASSVACVSPRHVVTCEEVHDGFGALNSLHLPPSRSVKVSQGANMDATTADAVSPVPPSEDRSVRWRPPTVTYATEALQRQVLQTLRRRHAARRCVQWASLPSPSAAAALRDQTRTSTASHAFLGAPTSATESSSSSLLLSSAFSVSLTCAHQTRPGWHPPVLLVLHNVDLLDSDETQLLLQLCAQFAFPHPHLQLLVSFDDPQWPLSPLAAALARVGVCAVQLRSMLLPRVHEMRHVSSIHLLTDFEAAAAAAGGSSSAGGNNASRRGTARRGRPKSALSGGVNLAGGVHDVQGSTAATMSGGSSHLLQDTMRRVLFSLPPAFNSLLRILLDAQEEAGDGVFLPLFTVTERFEQSGVMVSQGRLKALLRELTSNRIARYDSAEHALMVPQVARLRKVLEEVTTQREGGGGPTR